MAGVQGRKRMGWRQLEAWQREGGGNSLGQQTVILSRLWQERQRKTGANHRCHVDVETVDEAGR